MVSHEVCTQRTPCMTIFTLCEGIYILPPGRYIPQASNTPPYLSKLPTQQRNANVKFTFHKKPNDKARRSSQLLLTWHSESK